MAEKRRQWDLEYEAKLAAPVGPIHYDESKGINQEVLCVDKLPSNTCRL